MLALTKYGQLGASSRMRFVQYLPSLENEGIHVKIQPLLSDDLLETRYSRGSYGLSLVRAYCARVAELIACAKFDVIWIEKEALPWFPVWLERLLLRGIPYVLDYDDAVFHNYDRNSSRLVRYFYGRRLDEMMAASALVVGGNNYLAQRARLAGSRRVAVLPTVVDLSRYPYSAPALPMKSTKPEMFVGWPRIVWIGSPSTARYLELLREPLQELAKHQNFVLRVIGADALELPGVNVELVRWEEATEVEAICACDIGVMPLFDSPWEQGKCGYKLIQYMACGLPVVASKVGVNVDIVQSGENGYLAETMEEWASGLDKLLKSPSLRAQFGEAGRRAVEEHYSLQKSGPLMACLLRTAAGSL